MKRARFTEEQIIGVLREHEAGAKTSDLARKYGVSEATIYNWKAKFGGMDVSEAKRLRQLEDENAKLKKLLAEQMLDGWMQQRYASFCQKMYDPPRPCKGPFRIKDGAVCTKCIRPLASRLLLQPGHDEIRARRRRPRRHEHNPGKFQRRLA